MAWILDGDSLCVGQADGQMIEVRLADFSAPEFTDPGGLDAMDRLIGLTLMRHVTCTALAWSYDRTVARCRLNGWPLGTALRAAGGVEGGRGHYRRRKASAESLSP